MKTWMITAALFLSVLGAALGLAAQPETSESKIEKLIAQMTLDEKLDLIGGTGFGSKALPRLGIPSIQMIDGPQGVRGPRATAFPGSLASVATWNPELMRKVGAGIGREVRAIGENMILGPCVSLYRVPQSGRNYECFSEDPVLNSQMAVAYIDGVHDAHVMTSTKHFLLNEQEVNRKGIDMHIDERALHELELPAFAAAIAAKTESVMASYNLVDGVHASENPALHRILKKDFAFSGFIVSDWESTYDGIQAANSGLDLEMPYGTHMGLGLKPAIKSGKVKIATINDKVRRILRALYLGAASPWSPPQEATPELNSKENQAVALQDAEEAIVLLKNSADLLPLDPAKVHSIAVLGPGAAYLRAQGGGSGHVTPLYQISPLEGLRNEFKGKIAINYARGVRPDGQVELVSEFRPDLEGGVLGGFKAEYFNNNDLKGKPIIVRSEPSIQIWNTVTPDHRLQFGKYSARWSAKFHMVQTGPVQFDSGVTGHRYRITLDGKVIKDLLYSDDGWDTTSWVDSLAAGDHELSIEYRNTADNFYFGLGWVPPAPDFEAAIQAAKTSDAAILFVGTSSFFESEDNDRTDLTMPGDQDKLIEEVMKVNPNTIVVVNSGGPILMRSWRDRVPAILQSWFAGQEGGQAIARILSGAVNPSGKLPITLPRDLKDSPSAKYYLGQSDKIDYSTVSVLEGYRGYDAGAVEPEFPFGHGLSYTRFDYSEPKAELDQADVSHPKVHASMNLANHGPRAGAEVVQVYVEEKNPSVARPPRELKAFAKIQLQSGESRRVDFTLDETAFRFWDTATHAWKIDPGQFLIHFASSSRDLRIQAAVNLHGQN